MAGRFAWIMAGGAAILAGMAFQGDLFDDEGSRNSGAKVTVHHDGPAKDDDVAARVERKVEESIADAEVTDGEGRTIELSRVVREELAEAVTEVVKAEAALAMLKIKGAPVKDEIPAAELRVAEAKARMDALEKRIEAERDASETARDAERERIRAEIRAEVRDAMTN